MPKLIVATRGSALALRQVELVAEALRATVPDIEIETRVVKTEGDRDQTTSLEAIGGQGVFVKDIEGALLSGEAHIAVHSLKDMPAEEPAALTIAALLPREDPRDVFVSKDGVELKDLHPGARVGTDSRRRGAQLLAMRPDIEVVSIRGNVDTRLRKVESGDYDAAVLAAAGLERMGWATRATHTFDANEMIPAVGQGTIAVQCRKDDADTMALLKAIDDASARSAATAERAFLKRLGAGCRLPVGAYAEVEGDKLTIRAFVADDSGKLHKGQTTATTRTADIAGKSMAESLLMAVKRAGQTAGLER